VFQIVVAIGARQLSVGDLTGRYLAPFELVTLNLDLDPDERAAWVRAVAVYRPVLRALVARHAALRGLICSVRREAGDLAGCRQPSLALACHALDRPYAQGMKREREPEAPQVQADVELEEGCILCGGALSLRVVGHLATTYCRSCHWISRPQKRGMHLFHPPQMVA